MFVFFLRYWKSYENVFGKYSLNNCISVKARFTLTKSNPKRVDVIHQKTEKHTTLVLTKIYFSVPQYINHITNAVKPGCIVHKIAIDIFRKN